MKRLTGSLGVMLVVLSMSALALATDNKASAGPLTGTWEGVAHTSDGEEQFTMTLEQAGDVVKGSIATEHGQLDITSGSFKNLVLEIQCETPNATIRFTGKLEGGRLSGEWSRKGEDDNADNNDLKGTWEAKRSEAKPPAK